MEGTEATPAQNKMFRIYTPMEINSIESFSHLSTAYQ